MRFSGAVLLLLIIATSLATNGASKKIKIMHLKNVARRSAAKSHLFAAKKATNGLSRHAGAITISGSLSTGTGSTSSGGFSSSSSSSGGSSSTFSSSELKTASGELDFGDEDDLQLSNGSGSSSTTSSSTSSGTQSSGSGSKITSSSTSSGSSSTFTTGDKKSASGSISLEDDLDFGGEIPLSLDAGSSSSKSSDSSSSSKSSSTSGASSSGSGSKDDSHASGGSTVNTGHETNHSNANQGDKPDSSGENSSSWSDSQPDGDDDEPEEPAPSPNAVNNHICSEGFNFDFTVYQRSDAKKLEVPSTLSTKASIPDFVSAYLHDKLSLTTVDGVTSALKQHTDFKVPRNTLHTRSRFIHFPLSTAKPILFHFLTSYFIHTVDLIDANELFRDIQRCDNGFVGRDFIIAPVVLSGHIALSRVELLVVKCSDTSKIELFIHTGTARAVFNRKQVSESSAQFDSRATNISQAADPLLKARIYLQAVKFFLSA